MVSLAVFIWTITFLSTVGWQFWQKHGVSHNQNGRDFFAKTRTRVINAILVWWHFCAIWQWSPLLPALLILTYTLHGPCVLLPCILLATGENLYFRYLKHLVHLFSKGIPWVWQFFIDSRGDPQPHRCGSWLFSSTWRFLAAAKILPQ